MLESTSREGKKQANKNNYTTLRIIRAIKCRVLQPFSPYYLHAVQPHWPGRGINDATKTRALQDLCSFIFAAPPLLLLNPLRVSRSLPALRNIYMHLKPGRHARGIGDCRKRLLLTPDCRRHGPSR